jgi:S1-C subfamily serine protease
MKKPPIICFIVASFFFGVAIPFSCDNKPEETTQRIVRIDPTIIQEPNVVDIYIHNPEYSTMIIHAFDGLGSGVLISPDGIVLTAGHMLESGLPVSVEFYTGMVCTEFEWSYVDKDVDIGLFKIKNFQSLCYLELGNSDGLYVGSDIWAIGNPFGLSDWHCWGKIAKKTESGKLFMTMALNPGNSGCPILNECNEIVGICVGGMLPGNCVSIGYTSNICKVIVEKYKILHNYE